MGGPSNRTSGDEEQPLLEGKSSESTPKSKGYNFFAGYCYSINYAVGTGVLGLPSAFYEASLGLSSIVLVIVSVLSVISTFYINEGSARAWAIRRAEKKDDESSNSDDERDSTSDKTVPNYNIPSHDFIHYPRLCEIFIGRWAYHAYQVISIIYLFTTLWSYATVVVQTLTADIPLPGISSGENCADVGSICNNFSTGCSNAYFIFMAVFLVLVVLVGFLPYSGKVQQMIQSIFTILRVIVMVAIFVSVSAALDVAPYDPAAAHTSKPFYAEPTNWMSFSFKGLGYVSSGTAFSLILHHSVPLISQPVKTKKHLNYMYMAVIATAAILYFLIGFLCAMFFVLGWSQLASGRH
ncbi:hypothetical protein ADUPG1_008021, partial [Aduncisulcus paluster]